MKIFFKMDIIKKGCLWLGLNWIEAINKTIEQLKKGNRDVQIRGIFKDKYPYKLLNDEKVFICYAFNCWDNHRTYKTRIPIKYNNHIKEKLKELNGIMDLKDYSYIVNQDDLRNKNYKEIEILNKPIEVIK